MYKREIELSGHIIDSLTLPKTMDIIMDNGGDFDILEFEIGKRKSDTSKAKIMVSAESPDVLNSILDELNFIGVSISEIEDSRRLLFNKPSCYSYLLQRWMDSCRRNWNGLSYRYWWGKQDC